MGSFTCGFFIGSVLFLSANKLLAPETDFNGIYLSVVKSKAPGTYVISQCDRFEKPVRLKCTITSLKASKKEETVIEIYNMKDL